MARTLRELERADLILRLYAANEPRPVEADAAGTNALIVLNKVDLGEHPAWQAEDGFACRV
jgi:hypothetical protein